MKLRRFLCFAGACWSVAAAAVACGEDEATIAPADGGGGGSETSTTNNGDSSTSQDTSTTLPADAGEDGEAVTDGGSNIDPDASDDIDAGLDAAPCNTLTNDAPVVTSDCISFKPLLGGGALVAGKYHLKAVRAHELPAFCQNAFVPIGFKTTLELTVDGLGVGTSNSIAQIANGPQRTRTTTLDPPDGNTPPLVATLTCPTSNTGNTPYFSGLRNQKQVLILRGRYANTSADYHYEKQ